MPSSQNERIREYIVKGFVINDERLKNPDILQADIGLLKTIYSFPIPKYHNYNI